MRSVSEDLIMQVSDVAAALEERSRELANASKDAVLDVGAAGTAMLENSREAATAADQAAARLRYR